MQGRVTRITILSREGVREWKKKRLYHDSLHKQSYDYNDNGLIYPFCREEKEIIIYSTSNRARRSYEDEVSTRIEGCVE